jgi:hypothetical protein
MRAIGSRCRTGAVDWVRFVYGAAVRGIGGRRVVIASRIGR